MTIKQEFLAILDLMNECDLEYALKLIKDNFSLGKEKATWDSKKLTLTTMIFY